MKGLANLSHNHCAAHAFKAMHVAWLNETSHSFT
jgi:hypothetical protein